jgi:ribonuclease HI
VFTAIYTDGGCVTEKRVGGWAAVISSGPSLQELSGSERDTTNQRMEIRGAIEGLKSIQKPSRVKLHSDSAYLINCMNQKRYENWMTNVWRNSKKKPVGNRDLWEELLEVSSVHDVQWIKVKGHSGIRGEREV